MANDITLHYRSDTLSSAHRSLGDNNVYFPGSSTPTLDADATAIGGFALNLNGGGAQKQAKFMGVANASNTLTVSYLIRFYVAAATNQTLFEASNSRFFAKQGFWLSATKFLNGIILNDATTAIHNSTIGAWTHTVTAAPWTDLLITYDGAGGANTLNYYVDSSLVASYTPTGVFSASYVNNKISQIMLGCGSDLGASRYMLNEFVVFNYIVNPTNVTLVDPTSGITSTGQSLNGAARTGWVDSAKFNGSQWDSLTAAQIKSGVSQVQAGLTQTGSYTGLTDFWTSLAASEIKSGSSQLQNGTTVTGSYTGQTWSTLAAGYIANGIIQIQNSVTITGTLNTPTAASGTAGTCDIATIKETIRFVLDQNNTSTGAPVSDLSGSLNRRVQNIFTVNPEMIPIMANNFPFVTVYLSKKDIVQKTIAKDQVVGKREAELTFSVVGATFLMHNNTTTADTAQADCEYLMENTELILRSYADLNTNVRWQFPTGVSYHAAQIDEQTHLRVGMMDLSCKVFY